MYWNLNVHKRVMRDVEKQRISSDDFEAMMDEFASVAENITLAKDPRVQIIRRPLPKPFGGSVYRLKTQRCRHLRGFIFVALNGSNGKRGTLVLIGIQERTPWTYDEALDEILAELVPSRKAS